MRAGQHFNVTVPHVIFRQASPFPAPQRRIGFGLHLKDAIWAPTATQNLLIFKDIHKNGFKIATQNDQYSSIFHIINEKSEVIKTFKSYPLGVFIVPFYSA